MFSFLVVVASGLVQFWQWGLIGGVGNHLLGFHLTDVTACE